MKLAQFQSTRQPLTIVWDETFMVMHPNLSEVQKLLTFVQKEMEPGKGVKRTTVHPFEVVVGQDHLGRPSECLRTHHGFIDKVRRWAQQAGLQVNLIDSRLAFPRADMTQCSGFRFNQAQLLQAGLVQERSGLIGAPTRFGKTTLIANTYKAYQGVKTAIIAPGADLVLRNLLPDMRQALPGVNIKVLCSGSKDKVQSDELTLVSMDSMHRICPDTTRLLLIDEPHALATERRMQAFMAFQKARKIGFGATLEGRFDDRDPLIEGLIGPVLVEISYTQARDIGAVAELVIIMIRIPYQFFWARDRLDAYTKGFWQNSRCTQVIDFIVNPANGVVRPEWQIMGFINNEKQVEFLRKHMKTPFEVAMAKLFADDDARSQAALDLKSGKTRLCFASNIYAQGVTFSELVAVLNLAGGGASTQTIQKPGRVAEVRPGKRCGVVFDFMFVPDRDQQMNGSICWQLARESMARRALYEKKGFKIIDVNGYVSLQKAAQEHTWPRPSQA